MRRYSGLIFALLLVASAVGLRWHRLDRPIWNLDEGATFTMAQQVLAGDVLYRDAADNRSPLLPYIKALILAMAGDWNAFAVHLVLALLMGTVAILLWRIARCLGDETTGVGAAVIFTVLSYTMLDPADAISANTGWFVVIFSTAGFLAFVRLLARPTCWRGALVGLMFGCSFLCKQPGLFDFFAMGVLLALAAIERRAERRQLLWFGLGALAGAAAPVLAFIGYFAAHDAIADLVYYAYTFNTRLYIPEVPRLERLACMGQPFQLAWLHAPAAFVLGIAGAAVALNTAFRGLRRRPVVLPLLPWLALGWTASGILSTGLSGRTFSHYSAQVVPGLSLLCGWGVARLVGWVRAEGRSTVWRWAATAVLIAGAGSLGISSWHQAKELKPQDQLSQKIGRTVAAFTTKSDRIFVWGYYPEVYFFARRLPASRFIYTNYVTGMIAWTNLDSLIDTRYAVPPDAWAQLTGDLARHSPAVIVDAGMARGYAKYPLHDQTALWNLVRHDFAQVAAAENMDTGMRVFRRIEYADGAPLDGSIPESSAIKLSGYQASIKNEGPRLQVSAPKGATRLELYASGRRTALIEYPSTAKVDARFTLDADLPARRDVRAVITVAGKRSVSPSFDFATYARSVAAHPLPGPRLKLDGTALPPSAVDSPMGDLSPSPEQPDTWRMNTPEELVYACPADFREVTFIHGLYESVQEKSDGYDLIVELQTSGGSQELYRRRLNPRQVTADRGPQNVSLLLPPHPSGRLGLRFLPGPEGSPDFDWVYVGQFHARTDGPSLLAGDHVVLPTSGAMGDGELMKQHPSGYWLAHAPARVEWPRPPEVAAITLHYGMEDGSYTAPDGHSDGVDFVLELITAGGATQRFFSRSLMPYNHPEHRGPQATRIDLPYGLAGKLVLRVEPGPRGDPSWDWAWIGAITCEGHGPGIVVRPDREIMPRSSHVVDANGGPSMRNDATHWGAHADAELVYDRPADLGRVTFRYGLADGADRDASGKQRSAGVDVMVEFQPTGGPVSELFRRRLDPFHQPADLGEQTTTVELPLYQPGRLVFRITPAATTSNAYDWGYWGRFQGELSP